MRKITEPFKRGDENCANEGSENDCSPVMRSPILKTILIPTLEHDRRFVLMPHDEDTTSSAIVGPPNITRFPSPWVLIAQETPKNPLLLRIDHFRPEQTCFPCHKFLPFRQLKWSTLDRPNQYITPRISLHCE